MTGPTWLRSRSYLAPAAVYAVVVVALWPQPVLGLLHVQSAAVVAGVGFFAAGFSALGLLRRGEALGDVLIRHVALLAVPLALLTVTLVWRPNCGYLLGLLLFVTFTVPSVGLGVAVAHAIEGIGLKRGYLWFGITGLLVATLPVAYDLGLHPQLFTYNHVWGGVLGPLYDEELAIRPGLFFFRALTVCWAVALVLVGDRARYRRHNERPEESRRSGLALLAVGFVIAAMYGASAWLGINSPAWYIQDRLGGHLAIEHFDIYYDPDALSEADLAVIADVHRYRFAHLTDELEVTPRHRIATYLYPDPQTKAALTGSRTTSVVPTWLPVPQIHMLQDRFEASFAHELVHALAREFGMPVLRASPAVGLVEGLAVALEPPDGRPHVHAQVAAGFARRDDLGLATSLAAEGIQAQLGPLGFWGGRGAVSYSVMGSFVRFLIDEYGVEPVKQAYRSGSVERAFDKPVAELAGEWEAFIRTYPVDPEAEAIAAARFTIPSLFERRCPYHIPRHVRQTRAGNEALRRGDADAAERYFTAAHLRAPANHAALVGWATLRLAAGESRDVIERLEAVADNAGAALQTRLADAYRLAGRDADADSTYRMALERLAPFNRTQAALISHRSQVSAEAVRALIEPLPPEERAARLAEFPELSPVAALTHAAIGDYDEAVRLMEESEGMLPEAERQSWLAEFLHGARALAPASAAARQAAAAFEADGRAALSRREHDRAALLWHASMHADATP